MLQMQLASYFLTNQMTKWDSEALLQRKLRLTHLHSNLNVHISKPFRKAPGDHDTLFVEGCKTHLAKG